MALYIWLHFSRDSRGGSDHIMVCSRQKGSNFLKLKSILFNISNIKTVVDVDNPHINVINLTNRFVRRVEIFSDFLFPMELSARPNRFNSFVKKVEQIQN